MFDPVFTPMSPSELTQSITSVACIDSLSDDEVDAHVGALAAHIQAATCRLLEYVRIIDEREAWAGWEFRSCAHWLSWRTGLSLATAREQVRVASILPTMPAVRACFADGRLSYSKVRAIARICTPKIEKDLLHIALAGNTSHIEKTVRLYRLTGRLESLINDERRHAARGIDAFVDEDGMVTVRGRLPPEAGAMLMKALDAVQAETPPDPNHSHRQRRADALGQVAERSLAAMDQRLDAPDAPRATPRPNTADRYQVVMHVTPDVLGKNASAETSRTLKTPLEGSRSRAEIENVANVSAESARRVACDASLVTFVEDSEGNALDVGRKTRKISPALRRALQDRDGGCRFPGCTHHRWVDAHHVKHWAEGGETKLDNLVLLCRAHHRAVHEGGFRLESPSPGRFVFHRPDDACFKPVGELPELGPRPWVGLMEGQEGLNITHYSSYPNWQGERMDYGWALDVLCMKTGVGMH